MTNKHCLVYETLGKVSNLTIKEGAGDGLMRLEGVFGVCGIKNQNNRVYDKDNYRQMVESLQKTIKESGCPGELEHPNSMNINLENVSHKIESIQMNEDGTITGTIVLLNTPKGQIAQAIVEGGLPLYISSRGAGTITNEGRVTLSTIKTYDLVGTPGFSQAKLQLKENQTLECLNESLDDGNIMYAIVEGDDLLGEDDPDNKDNKDAKDPDNKDNKDNKDPDNKDKEDNKEENKNKDTKDNKNNKETVNMNDLKEAIEKLSDKVTSLEAQLHVAQESLENIPQVNYDAIQEWITNEYSNDFKNTIMDEVDTHIDEKMDNIDEMIEDQIQESVEIISNGVQSWVCEEFAPEVQNWVCEEFAPEVQNWVCEEFAPEVQNWVCEEFAPEVQNWITEEFAPVVDSWVTEEFGPSIVEEHKANRLEEIDSLLETLSNNTNEDLENIIKENKENNKYANVFVVENMPSEFKPSWETLSEERKDEIVRSSRMYDFTKEGVLESFWGNVDFSKKDQSTIIKENNQNSPINDYHQSIVNRMMYLRKQK